MTDPTIDDVFDLLDERRHLPKYKLELRSSPFFEVFLLEVLNKHFKPLVLNPLIIPEFPLKKDSNYQSTNVDFFAVSDDYEHAFFIELKTDMHYLKASQARGLQRAAGKGMGVLLSELNSIANAPGANRKYSRLRKTLQNLKLSQFRANLEPEIVYILPYCPKLTRRDYLKGVEVITFKEFANAIECRGELGKRFARSLMCWAKVDAGSAPPDTSCP